MYASHSATLPPPPGAELDPSAAGVSHRVRPFRQRSESTAARVGSIREATTRIDTNGTRARSSSATTAPDDAALAKHRRCTRTRLTMFSWTAIASRDTWATSSTATSIERLLSVLYQPKRGEPAVEEEVAIAPASQAYGQPRIIPIRLRFDGALRYSLGLYLNSLQYAFWSGPADSDRVIEGILETMARSAVGDPTSADAGALQRIAEYRQRVLDQPVYVSRGHSQPRDRQGRAVGAHVRSTQSTSGSARFRTRMRATSSERSRGDAAAAAARRIDEGRPRFLEVVHSLGEYSLERQDLHIVPLMKTVGRAERARRAARLAPIDPAERYSARPPRHPGPPAPEDDAAELHRRGAAENATVQSLADFLARFAMARRRRIERAARHRAQQICGSDWELRRALADRTRCRTSLWLLDGLDEARGWPKRLRGRRPNSPARWSSRRRPPVIRVPGSSRCRISSCFHCPPSMWIVSSTSVRGRRRTQGSGNSAELAARFRRRWTAARSFKRSRAIRAVDVSGDSWRRGRIERPAESTVRSVSPICRRADGSVGELPALERRRRGARAGRWTAERCRGASGCARRLLRAGLAAPSGVLRRQR